MSQQHRAVRGLAQTHNLLAALLVLATLGGCAAPANREAMTVATSSKAHPYSLSVETRGGNQTEAMGASTVSNEDLKAAIESSVTQSGLFKTVVQGKGGDYELTVSVTSIVGPMFGASFTVDMETAWTLTRATDKTAVLKKVIKSSHTATMSDAFVGTTRYRLAVEGAVRNNIAQGMEAIAALSL